MKNQDYLLTIHIPIPARDHLEARHKAKSFLQEIELDLDAHEDVEAKLQLIHADKAPEKVGI